MERVIFLINSFKERSLAGVNTYLVYRNLNMDNMFSIKDKKTGLVLAHGTNFYIENVSAKISESGRQKVISDGRKNVHCYLMSSNLIDKLDVNKDDLVELYYNPYSLDHFINKATGEKVEQIDKVYFFDGKAWINNT